MVVKRQNMIRFLIDKKRKTYQKGAAKPMGGMAPAHLHRLSANQSGSLKLDALNRARPVTMGASGCNAALDPIKIARWTKEDRATWTRTAGGNARCILCSNETR